jgi:hypothetical protein
MSGEQAGKGESYRSNTTLIAPAFVSASACCILRAVDFDAFASVCQALHALRGLEGEDVSMVVAGVRRMGRRKGEMLTWRCSSSWLAESPSGGWASSPAL